MDSNILVVGQMAHGSSSSSNDAVWKKIWLLDIPNKKRHFLWHICQNCLPIPDNLQKRRIPIDVKCVDEWVKKILQSLPPKDYKDFAALSYEIWGNRNDAFFNGKARHPLTLVSYALNSQVTFREANLQATTIQSPRHSSVWSLPLASHFKVNFDASISTIHQIVGIGVVVRSCDGQFIAGLSKKLRILSSAELAEALAAREVALLAKILMIPSFILEGDAFSVIKHISSSDEILSDLGSVLEVIRITLSAQHLADIVWTPRDANKVVHCLVNFAKTSSLLESLRLLSNN
ncbi:uncharacterized protein LOC113758091 [Coffea eugenioides]|uniref:RNase H type-1 domain-containing protein n=1 Tax=Coffea arabica TaxID=13443 RepID=A0A6P6T0T9_COFAR|nr:uncharacterized protein LOC113758091 [Coffea eugenioides]